VHYVFRERHYENSYPGRGGIGYQYQALQRIGHRREGAQKNKNENMGVPVDRPK